MSEEIRPPRRNRSCQGETRGVRDAGDTRRKRLGLVSKCPWSDPAPVSHPSGLGCAQAHCFTGGAAASESEWAGVEVRPRVSGDGPSLSVILVQQGPVDSLGILSVWSSHIDELDSGWLGSPLSPGPALFSLGINREKLHLDAMPDAVQTCSEVTRSCRCQRTVYSDCARQFVPRAWICPPNTAILNDDLIGMSLAHLSARPENKGTQRC